MKKLFYLFCLLSVILFIGCSNDDDEPKVKKFSPDVENILTSIQGTFSGEEYFLGQWFRTDKLTFFPFAAPVEKTTFKDGTVEVHGTVHRVQNKAVDGEVIDDYFFCVEPLRTAIVLYGYNSDNKELNEKKETLSYKIESHDIIKFKDYGLTDDNWIDYSRQ